MKDQHAFDAQAHCRAGDRVSDSPPRRGCWRGGRLPEGPLPMATPQAARPKRQIICGRLVEDARIFVMIIDRKKVGLLH